MRLERTTHSLEGCCSIQLSYGTVVFLFAAANIEAVLISPGLPSGLWQGNRIKTAPSRAFCSSTKREFGVRIKPAESFDSQNVFGNACNTPANTKKLSEALAGLPQTPKHFPWDLRGSRKRQKVFRGTCGTPANTKKFSEALAGLPQTPESFSWDLQQCCKHFQKHYDRCSALSKTSSTDWEPHSFVELTLRKGRSRARVGSPQVGEKPEGWCGIEAVALAAAGAVIANFRP